MKYPIFCLCIISCISVIGCTEEYDLQLDDENKLIINAEITNSDTYNYVWLGVSRNTFIDTSDWKTHIRDERMHDVEATIIISDDCGIIDTLVPAYDSIMDYYYEGNQLIDSSYIYSYLARQGYYQTTKIKKGKPGHTYYLEVLWNGHSYTSECTMPKAIKIDSLGRVQGTKHTDGTDGDKLYVYFNEDKSEDNYYIFKKGERFSVTGISNIHNVWSVSLLSDELLSPDINGMDVCRGEATESWKSDSFYFSYVPVHKLMMYSVTKEVYDYYRSLINQMRTDGGVFTPTPASAATNIKGGALGVFSAASYDEEMCWLSEEEWNE